MRTENYACVVIQYSSLHRPKGHLSEIHRYNYYAFTRKNSVLTL